MTLRLQIDYHFDKYSFESIPQTKVTKQQIEYNLVRCNPALAKYFSKNLKVVEIPPHQSQIKKKTQAEHKSILEQKNRNGLLDRHYPAPEINPQKNQPQQKQRTLQIKIDKYTDDFTQTSPKNIQKNKGPVKNQQKSPREQQIRTYFRQLKQTSRYLPDTAFRKYFNRQVFQNYGRENTHGTSDGIIYGNYLKTHNINPHSGQNRPYDEETFYHALVSASPQKLPGFNPNRTKPPQNERKFEQSILKEEQSTENPLKKHYNDPDKIIMDNLHQHEKLRKLSESRSLSKSKSLKKNHLKQNRNILCQRPETVFRNQRSQKQLIESQYVNKKQFIKSIKPQKKSMSNKKQNFTDQAEQINKFSEIKSNKSQSQRQKQESNKHYQSKECPVNKIRQNHMESILSKQCHVKKKINSSKKTIQTQKEQQVTKIDFGPGFVQGCFCNGSGKCKVCLKFVKNELKQKASQDIDLSNRIITSARKQVLYKNYSLNNNQNAKLNPHNFNRCSGQIYQIEP